MQVHSDIITCNFKSQNRTKVIYNYVEIAAFISHANRVVWSNYLLIEMGRHNLSYEKHLGYISNGGL